MIYNLIITDRAKELLDELVCHLIYRLKNEGAASHLFDGIEKIYDRLEENPYQFPDSKDPYLKHMGYKEAVVTDMNYILIFKIEGNGVYVLGIFHQLENYGNKI